MSKTHGPPVGGAALAPRKTPRQARSKVTYAAIIEGAACVLETVGFDAYTTKTIANRAGVSIGSLYQYFPDKDSITIALILREAAKLVTEVNVALSGNSADQKLAALIAAAVRHQLRRPALARLLDFEEVRLAPIPLKTNDETTVRRAIARFIGAMALDDFPDNDRTAADVMTIINSMTDAAGLRGDVDAARLERHIGGAVKGYLDAAIKPSAQSAKTAATAAWTPGALARKASLASVHGWPS